MAYYINTLVEQHSALRDTIQRENNMKHGPRAYKTRLIAQSNPTWRDLYSDIV